MVHLLRTLAAAALLDVLCGASALARDTPLSGLQDPPGLEHLKYRSIGPAWGGRVSRAVGVPGNPNIYYAATASGGVWKSADGGVTWEPVFDDQPIASIGSIAVATSDPNVIYVGSGEANIRGNVAPGNGIYRSLDAGKTWEHVWQQQGQIGTMAVHPRNPEIAFAAVLGHAFGPNPERGVYRTRDGGRSWEQVLKKDENTGASDVALDPSNPNIVFAGLWQARRTPWSLSSGGPGSGLYVSRDGGDNWKQLTGNGLPEGIWGKVGVAVAPSDGRRVYVLIEAEEGGLFRSDDGGETWTRINPSRLVRQRPWYYTTLAVHPTNPDEVWFPEVPMLRTIDGGKTLEFVEGLYHGDHHDVWFDPENPKRMIAANDGGVDISADGGKSWYAPPLPIGQFYHVSVDSRVPFHVAGAMQDIGTAQAPNDILSSAGIRDEDWYSVGGGEAGHVVSNPDDPNIVYAGEYGGYISLYDHRTRQARNTSIYPENPSGHGGEDLRYRFQWTAPIAVSPLEPEAVYHAANVLFKSTDGGSTWTAISPDLTRDDESKQTWSGGPITGDNTGVEIYGTIFAVALSPIEKDLIWAGSDDGLVHVTRDGGKSWKNVTEAMRGMPEWGTISMIEASRYDPGTAYVVVDAHRLDDMRPYLYKTTDFGESWTRLDAGLPEDVYLHAVREDLERSDILYLGTERGVALTADGGATWNALRLNLPTVAVHDIAITGHHLVLGTHGRSIWILDDLTPIREMSAEIANRNLHLFSVPDAIRWRRHYAPKTRTKWAGENPPGGALVYYWLKEEPEGEVTLDILDDDGRVIRTLSSEPREPIGFRDNPRREKEQIEKETLGKEPGVQRASWDLRYGGAELIPGAKLDMGNPSVGPLAAPGTYTVRLTAAGESATTTLRVLPDPRGEVAAEELEEQLRLALVLRDDVSRLTRNVLLLRSIRDQLARRNELLEGNREAEPLVEGSQELIDKLDALERQFHNPDAEIVYDILAMKGGTKVYSRMAPLYDWVTEGDGAPTQGMREVYADQKRELDEYETELRGVINQDLAALNETARSQDLPIVIVPEAGEER